MLSQHLQLPLLNSLLRTFYYLQSLPSACLLVDATACHKGCLEESQPNHKPDPTLGNVQWQSHWSYLLHCPITPIFCPPTPNDSSFASALHFLQRILLCGFSSTDANSFHYCAALQLAGQTTLRQLSHHSLSTGEDRAENPSSPPHHKNTVELAQVGPKHDIFFFTLRKIQS